MLTLRLDAASQAWFDAMRRAHFPPDRLVVGAHVTMFHALPGAAEAEICERLAELCDATAPLPVTMLGLRFLGRGVAYKMRCEEAARLRGAFVGSVSFPLTAQDRQAWSPHVTVQNKVSPEAARATMALLERTAPPAPITATGIAVWRYLGGPWEALAGFAFAAETAGA